MSYRVVLHREPFWISARISDDEFIFEADHQRGQGENCSFAVNFYSPWMLPEWSKMKLRVLHRSLSQELGLKIYVHKPYPKSFYSKWYQEIVKQPTVAEEKAAATRILRRRELRPFIAQLRKESYSKFRLYDTQMKAIGPIISPEDAARRILMLREMMTTVYSVSRKLMKEKPHA